LLSQPNSRTITDMAENPFAAPEVDLTTSPYDARTLPWFAVGANKLIVMSVATFGFYSLYWFERQFRFQKRTRGLDSLPLARAVFSIFFVNSLLKDVTIAAFDEDLEVSWTPSALAGLYIASSLFSTALNRVDTGMAEEAIGGALTMVASLSLVGVSAYPLSRAQATINRILERTHPDHDPNARYTPINIAWIVIFSLMVLSTTLLIFFLPEA
jgi:hypothetical protein